MAYHKFSSVALVSVLALGLAGCSSSSDSTRNEPVDTPAPVTGGDALAAAVLLAADAQADTAAFGMLNESERATIDTIVAVGSMPEATNLPAMGAYSGSMIVNDDEADVLASGSMNLTADFDGGTLGGTVTNIRVSDDEVRNFLASGTLDIEGTVTGADVAGTLRGTVATDGPGVLITGSMGGQFRGEGASAGAGTVNLSGSDEEGSFNLIGGWEVSRD